MQKEEIVWYPYPENKICIRSECQLLITINDNGDIFTEESVWRQKHFYSLDGDFYYRLPDGEDVVIDDKIIAFAQMPKGYNP